MRPTTSASAQASKQEGKAATPAASATTARPFPVSNSNLTASAPNHSDQIKSALDTLGIKLIKSEAERDVLKKLVEETRQTQQRLERELMENRKELAETRRKMDEQRQESEQSKNRQERLEEKLRDTQAGTLKLTRKMEADEQRRTRMQRRMERLELIASEAQSALQSRAMVLLTDQTLAEKSGLPTLPATGTALPAPANAAPMKYIGTQADTQTIDLDAGEPAAWWSRPFHLSTGVAVAAMVAALGFGWLASNSFGNGQNAVAVLQDGSLARIDLENGTLQPLQLSLKKLDAAPAETKDAPKVSEEGQPLPQAKPDESELAAPREVKTPVAAPEKDSSLTGSLKDLQDKAYEGIAEAQHDLAALYTAGSGVKQDYKRAAYWFRQAADAGVANAAYNLGVLHHQGLGVDKDLAQALDWYRQAALQNHPEAQYNLGIAYIEGIGAKYNPHLAAGFFQKAALSGITEAAYNLGLILENGLISEAKPELAMMWYRVGAEGGSMEARNALEQLARRMNMAPEKAGLLPDGTSLAKLVEKPENGEQAGTGTDVSQAIHKLMPELAEMIPGDDQLLTAQIQEQLARRNMYDGPEDGAANPKTADAVKLYEKAAGMAGEGKPTAALLKRLLAESTAENAKNAAKQPTKKD